MAGLGGVWAFNAKNFLCDDVTFDLYCSPCIAIGDTELRYPMGAQFADGHSN